MCRRIENGVNKIIDEEHLLGMPRPGWGQLQVISRMKVDKSARSDPLRMLMRSERPSKKEGARGTITPGNSLPSGLTACGRRGIKGSDLLSVRREKKGRKCGGYYHGISDQHGNSRDKIEDARLKGNLARTT